MQKINKICDKATCYKKWVEAYIGDHNYDSSDHAHSVRANLLISQNGVCAYTEIELDDVSISGDQYWKDGVYIGTREVQGQLDHFDPKLKKKAGWAWDNFFLVHSVINMKCKHNKDVFYILKPDSPNYNPFNLLDYDKDLHIFLVNEAYPKGSNEYENIEYMIEVLGLNFGFIVSLRRRYLVNLFSAYNEGLDSLEDLKVHHFFTAFEFVKQKIVVI